MVLPDVVVSEIIIIIIIIIIIVIIMMIIKNFIHRFKKIDYLQIQEYEY